MGTERINPTINPAELEKKLENLLSPELVIVAEQVYLRLFGMPVKDACLLMREMRESGHEREVAQLAIRLAGTFSLVRAETSPITSDLVEAIGTKLALEWWTQKKRKEKKESNE